MSLVSHSFFLLFGFLFCFFVTISFQFSFVFPALRSCFASTRHELSDVAYFLCPTHTHTHTHLHGSACYCKMQQLRWTNEWTLQQQKMVVHRKQNKRRMKEEKKWFWALAASATSTYVCTSVRLPACLLAPFCCQLVVACNINFLNLATSQETENSWP